MVFSVPRVRTLERKLEAKMIKEESDYHDLESVVQQVEQNLELMTVRLGRGGGVVTHQVWPSPPLSARRSTAPGGVPHSRRPLGGGREHPHCVSVSYHISRY